MTKLIILGSSAAIPSQTHANSHMAFKGNKGVVLVDCSGTQILRLERAGIDIEEVSDIILTHFHPDHVGGVPLLLMNMWLLGRQEALRIYGLHHCLERLEDMMSSYHWDNWPGFFPVAFHRLPERERVFVLEHGELQFFSSPVRHVVPTIGLRFEFREGEKTVVYSSDTEPCESIVRLAQGADVLIHEAGGEMVGHSSARQAGSVAQEANVGRLMLIHYPTREGNTEELLAEAQDAYDGEVVLAEDFMEIELG
jgi:ribonuclease Z